MGVCDICYKPGMGTLISSDQVREAVLDRGFDPFARGLVPVPASLDLPKYVDHWKRTVVAVDGSDWNLCARCYAAICSFFSGTPAPTGRTQGMDPMAAMVLAPLHQAMAREEGRKKDSDDMVGCLGTVGMIAAGVAISTATGWGFWASAGTVVGGLVVLALGIEAFKRVFKPAHR